MGLKVRALVLKNEKYDGLYDQEGWDYEHMVADRARFEGWISFDCVTYNPADDCVYCGITDFSNDIFYRYNRRGGRFESLNYRAVADRYDAKFHRSLELDDNGVLWAATALLHDVDRYAEAPGGAIVRYDTKTGKLEKVTIPIPHVYIQALVLDRRRRVLYGWTFTPERLFAYHIDTGELRDYGLIGSGIEMAQPERGALDDHGRVWGTWGVTRAFMDNTGPRPTRLMCLDGETGRITYFPHGIMPLGKYDKGRIDSMLTGHDGFVYIGSCLGGLYRLNPQTAEVKYIGKPVTGERMAGMGYGPDGAIYLACGRPAQIVRYRPTDERFEVLGPIRDEKLGEEAYQIHDLCVTGDGTLYAGENDNFRRSGYLWECTLNH